MSYTREEIKTIVEKQREYFKSGETLPIQFRLKMLQKLKQSLYQHEQEIIQALHEDLGRSEMESYLCDFGAIIMELNETIHGLKKWSKPSLHFSGFVCFPSLFTRVARKPYGVSLIISPFNFPFLLSIGVLIASIAGGNTAVLKASSKSEACTKALKKLIEDTFDARYAIVIDGGHDVADYCLEERFDKIFYTGSPKVAKHVMECASRNLTPVALELGGVTGNWCIVRKDADIKDAARKIAFFKALNAGQICININQVAVEKSIVNKFLEELKNEFTRQLGSNILDNEDYPHLICKKAYDDCMANIDNYKDKIVFGGNSIPEKFKVEPTVIYPIDINEPIVNKELFNPILPVVVYDEEKIEELLETIESREHGLAFYIFSKNKKETKKIMARMQFGGGCINEVCVHMMVKGVPFNGCGQSGMGAYHGKYGYEEFTHPCTVLMGKNKMNLSLREHPYTKKKLGLIKKFEK